MRQYLDLLRNIRENGEERGDRTGVGTLSLFGGQLSFDLSEGFPALTTKRLWFKGVKTELLWFLRGDTNIKWLQERKVRIWDEWADENGDLGPVYGAQFRRWRAGDGTEIDQIARLIDGLKNNPTSRRHVVNAWNVGELSQMALTPCHCLFQFYVHTDGRLSCHLYQRSADIFLGVPFNIASYALLTHMIAQVCGLKPGKFVHSFGDVHLYLNHLDQADLQLSREPKPLCQLWLNPEIDDIDDFAPQDIKLVNYESHGAIKAPIAV